MDFTIVAAIDQEGLIGVLRESLAMEVPVISTDCAGNSEIVIDKKTGLLVPPRNTKTLVEAMEWALTNPRVMKEMARRGREWIYHNCTIDVQCDGLLKVYKQVLNENTCNESVL
jgi:glycosyltransferase involved in cell wall biosynthesis